MNIKDIDDEKLIAHSEKIARAGRMNMIELMPFLREIERRRLFSKYKYKSLTEFMVDRLKFSEDEAWRRISAMHLMRELPEIQNHLADGSLNLTNIGLAQTLFSKEKKAGRKCSAEQKRDVIGKILGKSTRDAMKTLSAINPDMKKIKDLNFNSIEDDNLRDKLLQVKGLYAHIDPSMTLTDLLHKLCDEKIAERNKSPAAPRKNSEAEAYREVWRRDQGKCVKCGSAHAVEHEHIVPTAAGGKTTVENMELLCKNCNLRSAINFYGPSKMDSYLSDRFVPYEVHPH